MRRVIASLAVAAFLLACSFHAYTFVTPPAGHIAFGQDINGANYAVINPLTSADQRAGIGIAAVFPHSVTDMIQLAIQSGQEPPLTTDLASFPSGTDRVAFHYGLKALPGPGHYVFRLVLGSEILATGELDVTGSASPASQG